MKWLQCVARALVLLVVVNTASWALVPGSLRAQQTVSSTPASSQASSGSSNASPSSSVATRSGGHKVTPAKLIRFKRPAYPKEAKAAMIEGTVVLHGTIEANGMVDSIRVVSGPPALVQSAIDCVKKWKYRPTKLDGRPVKVETQVSVVFRLKP